MKDEINLLPTVAKKTRIRHIYQHRVSRIYMMVVIGAVLVLAAYGSVYWVLYRIQKILDSPQVAQSETQVIDTVNKQNEFLRAIEAQVQEREAWLPATSQALSRAPTGITVTTVELKKITRNVVDPSGQLTIQYALALGGQARSRAAVVEYERALQGLPWIDRVEAPLQNLANGDNISFSFTLFRKEAQL
ncbi:MAG: PilN domain-containing protein [Candidatus Andersenbacteria bacterium]